MAGWGGELCLRAIGSPLERFIALGGAKVNINAKEVPLERWNEALGATYSPVRGSRRETGNVLCLTTRLLSFNSDRMAEVCFTSLTKLGFAVLKVNLTPKVSNGRIMFSKLQLFNVQLAFEWLKQRRTKGGTIHVVGVSLACCVALDVIMRRPEIGRYVLVSPPVEHENFGGLTKLKTAGKVIIGATDKLLSKITIERFANKVLRQKCPANVRITVVKGAGHFLSGGSERLAAAVSETFLRSG
ncbi:MAG: hypothetical protein ACTS4Z_01015 [Candidatus Hodgkinia cicadicola]